MIEKTREVKKAMKGLTRDQKAEVLKRAEDATMDGLALAEYFEKDTLDKYEAGDDTVRRMIELDFVSKVVDAIKKGN